MSETPHNQPELEEVQLTPEQKEELSEVFEAVEGLEEFADLLNPGDRFALNTAGFGVAEQFLDKYGAPDLDRIIVDAALRVLGVTTDMLENPIHEEGNTKWYETGIEGLTLVNEGTEWMVEKVTK